MTSSSENTSETDAQRWFIRRSESWPTWAAAGRSASSARARTIGWKLPLLSIRPDATSTSGLSSMRVELELHRGRRSVDELAERAVDLRADPERQRVLDRARAAGHEQLAARRGTRGCSRPRRAARARASRAARRRRAPTGCPRSPRATRRARGRRPRRCARARSTRSAACPIATPFAEIRVSPSLGSSSIGVEPGRGEGLRAGHHLAPELGAAPSEEDLRDRRHVHQVRRADRAGRRAPPGGPRHSAASMRRLRHRPARARAAAGDAVEPDGHRRPDHGQRQRRRRRRPRGAPTISAWSRRERRRRGSATSRMCPRPVLRP